MICVGYSKRVPDLWVKETVPLKEQNERIREFAKRNGWKVSKFYEDKGNDPAADAGFQKLRLDGMNRRFDLVIIDSVWRCGRNPMYAKELLLRTFYPVGIHFVILEDGVNSLEKSAKELDEYFAQACLYSNGHKGNAQKYRELSERHQIDSLKERYGYVLSGDRTRMLVDREAAPVIRKIFDMAEEGKTWREIAELLNEKGIESPGVHLYRVGIKQGKSTGGSGKWLDATVSAVVRVRAYVGGEERHVGGTVRYPPIISREQYERVALRLRDQSNDRGEARAVALLFKGRITWEDTDEVPHFTLTETDGETKIVLKRKGFDDPVASYDDFRDQLTRILTNEKERARRVRERIEAGETKGLWERIFYAKRENARELFRQSVAAQEGNVEAYLRFARGEIGEEEYERIHAGIMERQRDVNKRFEELMDGLDGQRKLLTIFNPWIRKYADWDEEKPFSRKAVTGLVERVTLWGDGTVKVRLSLRGREAFPREWLEES